ncbi:AsmA2 domain-containing protein YhdP [Erwinia pyrifoliae]|uniref:AsmA2 domain-containing protein YhdP n=1 Tax=Erwinia pyrifoliae TaxID=79967 RepID=UPI0001C13003|nr:AsmA2 domain-containing protein YhdP [Erwinia pyrifoliae]AUX74090.1 DUF3971 domain-containing protein [Erwinia pyrifoliae]MCA8875566.1 AsmA2 domain-containing protein [Erwinia pyrifoliae]UXK12599.1 AsmA2 domain-containing protein YhdP [Erwinia pyrifoliae]CAY72607.1 Uncharacterized protein yhdP precursor [Erwinia pyrifoliae DSM 12163]
MRQLPRILLLTCATLVVVTALAISGLRLLMPHMNSWRTPILERVSAATGVTVQASALQGSWENVGPRLEIADIQAGLADGGSMQIQRVTLALDIWQSLLHLRWQFRDLTFWHLRLATNTPLSFGDGHRSAVAAERLNDLFLHQFDHFDLRDSEISFLTPSGQRDSLAIPQLTWMNEKERHRAEGLVSLSSITGQHGVVQVRLDLSDSNGYLDTGRVWMQADDVDIKPWLGQWMRDNTSLQSARFSLAAWMEVKNGDIHTGDIWLKEGGASWQGDAQTHRFSVDNLTAHISRFKGSWSLKVPQTRFIIDDQPWPHGQLSLLWQPQNKQLPGPDGQPELRLRATDLDLQHLEPLIPLFARLSPKLLANWQTLQPRGQLSALALDIPLQKPEQTRFQAKWHGLSWRQWQLLPGMENLDGTLAGGVADGRITFQLQKASLPYGDMFRAPLEIERASGALRWQYGQDGLTLSGQQLDVKARSLWARGDFRYQQQDQAPHLAILAGINLTNAGDAWRYFPEPLMGKSLTDYLSGAIKGGEVHNATLLFAGDPHQFPFAHHEGMFEVAVPLRQATYEFQPGWPALENLDINLDFANNGLWMQAPEVKLGEVNGHNISAAIPDYLQQKLIIDGDIRGDGSQIRGYFNRSPLKSSLGAALEELQIGGDVSGRLHLDIPLNGQEVQATGDVNLKQNSLLIKPLGTRFEQLTGRFVYDNGNLKSDAMSARWFGQPLGVRFTTQEGEKDYRIGVDLDADWRPGQMPPLPSAVRQQLAGNLPWQARVQIALPHRGGAEYQIGIEGDLKNVSSHLPSPLNKASGEALPIILAVKGDLKRFDLSGALGDSQRFNSRWLLGKQLRAERGVWQNNVSRTPALPDSHGMLLNLPPLDGEAWLGLLGGGMGAGGKAGGAVLPGDIRLHTPALSLAGQQWQDLTATLSQGAAGEMKVAAEGKDIHGSLAIKQGSPWAVNLKYLYYNPQWDSKERAVPLPSHATTVNFSRWPALRLNCDECWLGGQNMGRMQAELQPSGDTLTLKNGLIDSGSARLTASGEWVNRTGEQRTALKGVLSGKNIDRAINWFGVTSPLRDAPFKFEYDLHWRAAPWQPSSETLSGVLKSYLGSGHIADISTGRTGQLLRLVSFDALLRKLRLDFSDTFSQGFYFDSINATAWIENGVMHTDNLLLDGLEADIAMNGDIDLVQRRVNLQATVAPEISASVGVATAFVINPIVGAAVFAASKVLGPLWNKISVLRYHISGPIDKPQIDEVLRKPREVSEK